ncbi:LuxR C-terminal-related transcriptional regulator [Rhodopseudomonas sp. NSM]|uniref:LuxR C-terminal-related transcriptional regulator n=1 Tax=Rhodopseudomonas sp. NSM TaxID=3457630 RepID=UPI0040373E96
MPLKRKQFDPKSVDPKSFDPKSFDPQSPAAARLSGDQGLNGSHVEPVSSASMWATDEIGAAIAHQMNEPLTALLLYLYEIKHRIEVSGVTEEIGGARSLLETAIQEAKRACDIMDRLNYAGDRPADIDNTIARGRHSVDAWRHTLDPPTGLESSRPPVLVRSPLTPREREVMALIAGGSSNKEGSHRLGISTRTFEVHRARVMEKIGARNAADLVRIALSTT